MYNNDDLLTLLHNARSGGDAEYERLMSAVYDVLIRVFHKTKGFKGTALANHDTIYDAIHEYIVRVTDDYLHKYDESYNNQPISYITNGLNNQIRRCYRDHYKRHRAKPWNYFKLHIKELAGDMDEPNDELYKQQQEEHYKHVLATGIKTLPLKQQDALEGFMRGEKLRETAVSMGITGERVRQIRQAAVRTLKAILKEELL